MSKKLALRSLRGLFVVVLMICLTFSLLLALSMPIVSFSMSYHRAPASVYVAPLTNWGGRFAGTPNKPASPKTPAALASSAPEAAHLVGPP